ncbi:AMP deaminase [Rhynchospora pubera]|uniref:AMP deaminase n=1 Tax=Rhynchospora pubera TaxID=906938 RepID=A0AAV8HHF5_9POAL|nr:AMP deaminase [Rhynchospora pubera]
MDSYPFHLAMAALLGASFAALSAVYMHHKTLSQLIEFTQSIDRKKGKKKRRNMSYQRLIDDRTGTGDGTDEEDEELLEEDDVAALRAQNQNVPSSLPRLNLIHSGNRQSFGTSSNKSVSNLIRPISPKSPALSSSFNESDEDENFLEDSKFKDHHIYLHTNGNTGIEDDQKGKGTVHESTANLINGSVELKQSRSKSMIRSLSQSGNLHGAQPDPVAADILRRKPEEDAFTLLNITPTEMPTPDEIEVYQVLQRCLEMRESYLFKEEVAPWEKDFITDPSTPKPNPNPFVYEAESKTDHFYQMVDGVVHVYPNKESKQRLLPIAGATTFFTDLHFVLRAMADGNIRTVCHNRLNLLEQKFNLHLMMNADRELLAQKSAPRRDFYNVRKVDTHVHHSACMNQKHLLRFIKSKLRKEPDEVVIFRDGTYLTLKEVFESLDLTGDDLNVDLLDVHADKSTFHRFDKFNLKYNPCGQSRLREIFLKQENLIQGRFLAELTKEVFSDLVASKYQMAEYRISIYGRKQSEWDQLASWIVNYNLYSQNVVWLIQIPRIYNIYKEMGTITSFQNLLDNIFLPLFEVTVDPNSHPQLHLFLKQVVGLDLVDDESKPERRPTKHMPTPAQWVNEFNPAYAYYAYYCYANLYTLNKLREWKGMNTIKFRPHSGEAGDIDHLAATFLTAHNIAHGVNLRKSPVLQYLYYLAQIGLAMSPLSNNSLFLDYHRNPFQTFFFRGLNVSLSTDDPLQIHLTKEPLVEEYSIAAALWKLSSCDLCEIARNSVYQSGFSHACKSHWIGRNYYKRGPEGNNIYKTNVPRIRVEFRHMIWREEMQLVYLGNVRLPEEIDT